jgi:hypothetical protein
MVILCDESSQNKLDRMLKFNEKSCIPDEFIVMKPNIIGAGSRQFVSPIDNIDKPAPTQSIDPKTLDRPIKFNEL